MVVSIVFIIGTLLVQVFRQGRITATRIQGAIAVYLTTVRNPVWHGQVEHPPFRSAGYAHN
jgi:hypothetical protein